MPQNSQLDEQRLLYIYQGLNAVLKLLNHHLDQNSGYVPQTPFDGADTGKIIGMAWQAHKNGKITEQQYQEIFDIATGIKTVDVPAQSQQAHTEPFGYLASQIFNNRK